MAQLMEGEREGAWLGPSGSREGAWSSSNPAPREGGTWKWGRVSILLTHRESYRPDAMVPRAASGPLAGG